VTQRFGAAAVFLFIGAWALATYVHAGSPFAVILLVVGVIAGLIAAASTDLGDRIVWGGIARKVRPHLSAPEPTVDISRTDDARQAGNRVLAELQDASMRLTKWKTHEADNWFLTRHDLPVSEWAARRDELAGNRTLSEAWEQVSGANTKIDMVNRERARL
jgi:hypothetical protein